MRLGRAPSTWLPHPRFGPWRLGAAPIVGAGEVASPCTFLDIITFCLTFWFLNHVSGILYSVEFGGSIFW